MARIPRTSTQNRCTVTRRLCTHNESCGRGRDASAPLCGVLRARVRCARRRLALLAGAARWQVTHARTLLVHPARAPTSLSRAATHTCAGAGWSQSLVGVVLLAQRSVSFVAAPIAGALADRFGARITLVGALFARTWCQVRLFLSPSRTRAVSLSRPLFLGFAHCAAADARITDACWRRGRAGVAASSRVWCCCARQRW